ncbi:MAG: DUF11 domain-containing protein [Chloroflexi bacterium]|nr:MAG: DUF11 domain-containing protein [Chloroflexota bacterium]
MGTVFDDENGDSTQDHGELGIEGVTVSVGEVDLVTNNYGIFTIPINESDTYPIIEIDPDGYHSTTPNEVFVTVSVPKNTYIVNFGDSLNVAESSFFGAVFHDLNADTAHNPNEPYLEGVTVQMTRDGNLPVTFETNEWGQYTFLIDEAGVYAITETDPSGFVSTTAIPGTADVELINNNTFRLTVDETLIGVDFGNNLFGDVRLSDVVTISGIVWNDNGTGEGGLGDGTMDSEEPGLEGAVVSLSSGMSQITGVDGTFLLYAPAGEEVVLTESNPEEYVSTNAIPGLFGTYTDDDTISFAEMPAGTVSTENLFGDVIGADLQVVKTASSDTVVAGTELTYEIVVTNNGPASATGIEVMDDLPASLTLVSADPGEGEFDVDTNEWTIGSLEPGASATLTLVVLVDTDVTGDITNAVSVEGEQYDPDDGNNDDDLTTIVETEADLSITKTSLPDYVAHGAIVTYRLTFTNQGPSDALDLEITDTLPEALMNIDVVEQPDWLSGPTHIGQTMTWTAGELAAGSDGTIIINARMKPDAEGIIQNVATITSSTTDPVASNNSDTADTIIGLENTATIYGWVYEDLDEDMVRDDSEPGISGVTITLDGSENTQSGNDGLYVFFTEQDGDHTVVETDPDGYVSTTPNTAIRTAVLGESVRADFGDISGSCECTGDDYEDDDVDSAAVAAVFGVPQQYNFCDDFGDWIVFDVRHGHTYTITTNSIGVRADTSITLYDQDGTVLVSNDDLLGSDIFSSQIIWTAGTDGYVYVEFTNMADLCGCSTEYEVLVEESVGPFYLYLPLITEGSQPPSGQTILPEAIVSEPEVIHDTKGEITHICADDFEIDDEWWSTDVNTANNQILAGVEQSHSFDSNPQLYAADKDHLWFEILKGDTVNFTTTSKDGVIPFLELLDQKGDRIGVHGQDSLQWTATENGTYYLQVSPSGDEGTMSWGCYDIAGYDLLMTVNELLRLFLPLITQ